MNTEQLRRDLAALRAELDALPDASPGRRKLDALAARIEEELASTPESTLLHSIRDSATEFELEHPQAAAVLQRLVQTLSSMGI